MESTEIRKKLHEYVEKGDEKLLRLMYAIAKTYEEDNDFEYELTEDEISLLEERRSKRLQNESKVYNWNDARDIIINKKSINE
jgi:hypothetical protein